MDQLFRKKGISKLTMAYGLMFILFFVQPFQNLWWIFTYGVKETHIGFSDHFYTALEQFYESWSYIVTYTVIGIYRLIEVICLSLLVVLSSKVTRTKKPA